MTAVRANLLRLSGLEGDGLGAEREMSVVDAREPPASQAGESFATRERAQDLELLRGAGATAPAADVSTLMLSPGSLGRAREVREALRGASDGDPAEQLLEELVAGEVAVGHQLQDLEAAAAVLLGRVLMDPALAVPTAKVAREIIALSTVVRRRTEGTLNAVAGLRAQRVLLAAQRGRFGV